jgi:beta-galactosidase
MQLGISYYPEYYPKNRWREHFEILRDGGFRRVRFGESSWATFQPSRSEFRWEVLDEAIEMAADFGVEVVLGTPTYVPPLWLVKEHPEILPVGQDGRRTVFGARQHRCFNTPAYVDASLDIARAMAERYGKHPNVVAWQIDNELGGEQKRCYCDNCRSAFQRFLKSRYGTIEDLNRRWNTVFWGQQYDAFEDIGTPIRFSADLEMRHHPALELDFQRFCSESIVTFCEAQFDVIYAHTVRPITHNTDSFYWGDNVNVWKLFRKMDVAGMDLYSDRPFEIAFYADLTRSISKGRRFWMMEYGTRSPNLVEEMEINAERGCEWFYLFKMLPFPWGQEIDRKALLTLSGKPEPNYHAVRNWAGKRSSEGFRVSRTSRVGLVYDFDSSWSFWVDQWRPGIPIPDRQVYPKYLVEVVYQALFKLDLGVDVIFSPEEVQDHDVIIDARHLVHTPEWEAALVSHCERGGQLVTTMDLFRRNADNAWLEKAPDIYRRLFGWEAADFPDDVSCCHSAEYPQRALLLEENATMEMWLATISSVLQIPPPMEVEFSAKIFPEKVYDQRGPTPVSPSKKKYE